MTLSFLSLFETVIESSFKNILASAKDVISTGAVFEFPIPFGSSFFIISLSVSIPFAYLYKSFPCDFKCYSIMLSSDKASAPIVLIPIFLR